MENFAVELPFNLPQVKVFARITLSFIDTKSVISALNYLHLKFSSV
jgi:hypothetical protein